MYHFLFSTGACDMDMLPCSYFTKRTILIPENDHWPKSQFSLWMGIVMRNICSVKATLLIWQQAPNLASSEPPTNSCNSRPLLFHHSMLFIFNSAIWNYLRPCGWQWKSTHSSKEQSAFKPLHSFFQQLYVTSFKSNYPTEIQSLKRVNNFQL